MLKLPHISKPISQFGWIISDSNNQNEILFLIVYTKKQDMELMKEKIQYLELVITVKKRRRLFNFV